MGREYTKAQKQATDRYMQGRKTLRVVVTEEEHKQIMKHAEAHDNGSMNAFVKRAISEQMERDKR
jgi:predicted HicB family RNase H-like nuclease